MNRNIKRLVLFLFIAAAIIAIVSKDNGETQNKRQCDNNHQSCPEKPKKNDGVNFMNPLNRFIVAA
ncbi:MAG: hypothetical protein ACOVO1_06695 [Chitinophagaceae bacterium]